MSESSLDTGFKIYDDPDEKLYFAADFADGYPFPEFEEYYLQGSNPRLLKDWKANIHREVVSGELIKILFVQFLHCNPEVDRFYSEIGKILGKDKVRVVSIPLQGYKDDKYNNDKILIDYQTGARHSSRKTKREYAEEIYSPNHNRNYQLLKYPLRFAKVLSKVREITKDGSAESMFSVHCKLAIGLRKDGSVFFLQSSMNTDIMAKPIDNYLILVKSLDEESSEAVLKWTSLLREFCIDVEEDDKTDKFMKKEYCESVRKKIDQTGLQVMLSAPFLIDSSTDIFKMLRENLNKASRRILIAGEHIGNLEDLKETLAQAVNRNVPLLMISQTDPYSRVWLPELSSPKRSLELANYIKNSASINSKEDVSWVVHRNNHFKCELADDTITLLSSNFCYVSFSYSSSDFEDECGFSCIFCETASAVTITDKAFADWFVDNVAKRSVRSANQYSECFPFSTADKVLTLISENNNVPNHEQETMHFEEGGREICPVPQAQTVSV